MYIKNTASQNLPFVMINASTGAALTGATVSAFRCIDGGAQAACTGTVAEKANGEYNLALSQADTNGDTVGYTFTATSGIPQHTTIAFFAANLPADVQTIKTQAVTCAAGVTVLASVGTAATSTAQTGDSFGRIGAAGAGLTAIGDTRIANLDATVSSRLTPGGTLATLTTYTGNTPQTADLGAAITELSQAQPPTNPTLFQAVMALYMALRNQLTTTSTTKAITNNAGTVIFKKTLSDDGVTYTETKAVSGP